MKTDKKAKAVLKSTAQPLEQQAIAAEALVDEARKQAKLAKAKYKETRKTLKQAKKAAKSASKRGHRKTRKTPAEPTPTPAVKAPLAKP